MVFGLLDHADIRPEKRGCPRSGRDGGAVIAGDHPSLELHDVIAAHNTCPAKALHKPFIFILVEVGASPCREVGREAPHCLDEAPRPNEDLTGGIELGLAGKVQKCLRFDIDLVEWLSG